MNFIILWILLSLCDIIAVLSARLFVETNKTKHQIISMLFFALSALFFVKLMPFKETAVISMLWISLSTIFILIFCNFFFKEKISFQQGIGMIIVFLGMNILSWT